MRTAPCFPLSHSLLGARQWPRTNYLSSPSADALAALVLPVTTCEPAPLTDVPFAADAVDTIGVPGRGRRFLLRLFPFLLSLALALHLPLEQGLARPTAGFCLLLALDAAAVFAIPLCCGAEFSSICLLRR